MPENIKVEPYWNVKDSEEHRNRRDDEIKVEPYWNVKIISPWLIYFASN